MWYIYAVEYTSAIRKDDIMPFGAIGMDVLPPLPPLPPSLPPSSPAITTLFLSFHQQTDFQSLSGGKGKRYKASELLVAMLPGCGRSKFASKKPTCRKKWRRKEGWWCLGPGCSCTEMWWCICPSNTVVRYRQSRFLSVSWFELIFLSFNQKELLTNSDYKISRNWSPVVHRPIIPPTLRAFGCPFLKVDENTVNMWIQS